MLDTNIFDRLDDDPEAAFELENRRDLRLLVSEIQLAQLAAIPDAGHRERCLEMARRLCSTVSASLARLDETGGAKAPGADRHEPDRMIAAATAARCDMLVSDDRGLLEYARAAGVKSMDWDRFVGRIVFRRP